jgi:hypothetical protein
VSTWFTGEPPYHPGEVHHGGSGTMLQMGFREADIPCAAHVAGANAIGERAFNPRTARLFRFELWGGLACSARHQRLVLLARPEGEIPSIMLGTFRSLNTLATISTGKLDLDDGMIAVVDRWGPVLARVSHGADHALLLPIDREMADIKGPLGVGLPADTPTRWAAQVYPIDALALCQEFGIDIARVHDMALI